MRKQRLVMVAFLVLVTVMATGAYAAQATHENCPTKAQHCTKTEAKADSDCPCSTCTVAKKDGKCEDYIDADRNGACDTCVAGVCGASESEGEKKEAKPAENCPLHQKTAARK